jgi:hypothetical protein
MLVMATAEYETSGLEIKGESEPDDERRKTRKIDEPK